MADTPQDSKRSRKSRQRKTLVYTKDVSENRLKSHLRKSFSTRENTLLTIGLLLVLSLIVLDGFNLWTKYAHKDQRASEATEFAKVMRSYKELSGKSQYKLAVGVLTNYLNIQPKNKAHRQEAETDLAISYQNINQPKDAVNWYKKAIEDSDKPSYGLYLAAAQASESAKDKAAAINYYQKCVDILTNDKTSKTSGPTLLLIQSKLIRLKNAP
ncbi:MAG: hypothetical protein JWS12_591 [Candidatus Saccharibacteria bacterium]|nr:hypothetical protein [Candidatus Saccharibacteria bacterium]